MAIDSFREDEPLGTVGALRLMNDPGDRFLVMNCDVLTDLDLAGFLDSHRGSGVAATIFSPRALSFIEPGRRLDFPELILRLLDAPAA